MKKLVPIILSFVIILSFFNFSFLHAADTPGTSNYHLLQPCKGSGGPISDTGEQECGFSDFIKLVNRVITFLFYISIALATISFIYCGFLFLTAGGDTGKAAEAKKILWKVVVGFIWIFIAFLVVHFILSTFELKDDGYSLIESK